MNRIKLAWVNKLLLCLIILINGYIILAPLMPTINFWWQSHHTHRQQDLTAKLAKPQTTSGPSNPQSQSNQLIVPAMLLDTPILEGPMKDTYKILDKGIWRLPASSTPDKGGNTVIVGHRFTYTQPQGIFYYLNKVSNQDTIGVVWSGKKYLYSVTSVSVVLPNDTAVEANTADPRLTLYTCTPLWNPKDRLVVVAELQKGQS